MKHKLIIIAFAALFFSSIAGHPYKALGPRVVIKKPATVSATAYASGSAWAQFVNWVWGWM